MGGGGHRRHGIPQSQNIGVHPSSSPRDYATGFHGLKPIIINHIHNNNQAHQHLILQPCVHCLSHVHLTGYNPVFRLDLVTKSTVKNVYKHRNIKQTLYITKKTHR